MRLVLDISVFVAAIRSSNGASKYLILNVLDRRYSLLVSVPLVLEYEAVLTREEHLAASGLSRGEVNDLLEAIVAVSAPVRLSFSWRPMLQDPNDDMVLETAANGGAEAIVTFNRKHFLEAFDRFGIEVLSPGKALRRIGQL